MSLHNYTKTRAKGKRRLSFYRLCWIILIKLMLVTGRSKQILAAVMLCLLSVFSYTTPVMAAQSNSTNYGVSEVNFGSGGELHACSTTYCAKQSAGELVVGNTASTNYQAQGGFNTNREEFLEVTVSGTPIELGNLSAGSTKFGSTTFSVKSYLASGYIVTVNGYAPRNKSSGYTLASMSSATTATTGTEQFGINLVSNTSPSVGSAPQQIPDSTFSFGTPATGYNTANNFKFVPGDTIAQSLKSSGTTTYTLSTIENISTSTPAGAYRTNLLINVVPSF
jgi:hypothetical protein